MARATRRGRPRRWPPPMFFTLIAVGMRPIAATRLRPARPCARRAVVQRPGANSPEPCEATRRASMLRVVVQAPLSHVIIVHACPPPSRPAHPKSGPRRRLRHTACRARVRPTSSSRGVDHQTSQARRLLIRARAPGRGSLRPSSLGPTRPTNASCAWGSEATRVTEFGRDRQRREIVHAAETPQPLHPWTSWSVGM